jgi:hypothetical protein
VSTRCNEQLTFDIPPYPAVAATARELAGSRVAALVISPSVRMLKRRAGCSWGCRSPR